MQVDLGGINILYGYLLGNWKELVVAFTIIFVFFILKSKLSNFFIGIIYKVKIVNKKSEKKELEKVLFKPLTRLIVFFGIYMASSYLPFSKNVDIVMIKLFKSALIITIASGLYHLESMYEGIFYKFDDKLNLGSSAMLKQVLVKIIRTIIIALAIAIVTSEFFDVSGFIAGLGIAGIAFAMAAQDTLGSLFAGLSIILDKPFDVGDWILCSDIEGVVEELSFKSTRIRTFSKEIVSVPNQILANNPISNFSRRGMRRVNFKLGLTYSTTRDQMVEARDKIEEILKNDSRIENENIIVRFEGFNDSSLDILINYYTKTIVFGEYLEVKENINLQIMAIMENCGVSAAFPSTSVYFESDLKTIS